jgi:hypothetical protein
MVDARRTVTRSTAPESSGCLRLDRLRLDHGRLHLAKSGNVIRNSVTFAVSPRRQVKEAPVVEFLDDRVMIHNGVSADIGNP